MYKNEDILKITNIQEECFYVTWKITSICNYHCEYCTSKKYLNKNHDSKNLLDKAERINTLIKTNNTYKLPVKLKLIGGEVTLINLFDVLNKFTELNKLVIATNLSRDSDYFYNLENYCKGRNIQLILICSYHSENQNFIEKFIKLNNWCIANKVNKPQAAFVITNNFNFKLIDSLLENNVKNIKLTCERILGGYKLDLNNSVIDKFNYYIETIKKLNKSIFTYRVKFKDGSEQKFKDIYQFVNNLDNNGFISNNFYCSAGKNRMTIGYEDEVYLNKCNFLDKTILGTIWDNIVLPNEYVLCKAEDENKRCIFCSAISVSKEKDLD